MPKKLLLADDSITIQKVVGITLANEDLEITSVDNGEDAITRARQIRPDLVLADASMPKKDGYQVAEALKGDPATAGIPVLILAGQLEGHPDQGRLAACRADGFIPKPFESAQLIERVRKLLGITGSSAAATPPRVGAAPATAPRPAPAPAPAPMAAPAPRPAPAPAAAPTPIAAPRPMPAAAPIAAPPPRPMPPPAPAPMAARPAPAPAPAPAPPPAPAPAQMAAAAIDETDFGELSSSPASSGDTSLWNDAPVGMAADDPLWGSTNGVPSPGDIGMTDIPMAPNANGTPPDSPMDMVTSAAELANIEKFQGDTSPSGLELDGDAPKARERVGDDNLVAPPPAPIVPSGPGASPMNTSLPVDAATALAAISPEKLEQIVREVVRQALQPIIEKIAWEVVPDLAEDIIKDEIKRLTQ